MSFDWVPARRFGVWALLVALILGPFGPVVQLHADAGDDPACDGPALTTGHHQATPTLSAPRGRDGDGHCAVCHWLHALRSVALPVGTSVGDDSAARSLAQVSRARAERGTILHLPARAPPLASTLG